MSRVAITIRAATLCMAMTIQAHAATALQAKAITALKQAHDEPHGSFFEHGGMLVSNNGTLRFIEPHPENDSPDSVFSYDKKMLLADDVMVGTYHTHPCMVGYYHQYFSVPDIIVAFYTAVPTFMLDECTGAVHEFFSATDTVHETGADVTVHGPKCERRELHLPSGRIVGNIGEWDIPHVNTAKEECP